MMRRYLVFLFVAVIMVLSNARNSHAVLTFPTIELTDVTTIAAGMLALLGTVWALKKALGFLGGR